MTRYSLAAGCMTFAPCDLNLFGAVADTSSAWDSRDGRATPTGGNFWASTHYSIPTTSGGYARNSGVLGISRRLRLSQATCHEHCHWGSSDISSKGVLAVPCCGPARSDDSLIRRHDTNMFWLGLILTIPFLVATSGVTLWSARVFGQLYSRSDDSLIWGLDAYGLWILGIGICIVLGKSAAPVFMMKLWPVSRIAQAAFTFFWLGTLLVSAIFVIPAAAMERLGATQVSDPRLLYLAAWPVIDAIASVLPAVLTDLRASTTVPTTTTLDRPVSSGSYVFDRSGRVRGPSIPAHGESDLLGFLQDLTERPTGLVLEGVEVTPKKEIVTSQRRLAELRSVSKSTINRELHTLEAVGHIHLRVTARETRICVLQE